MVGAVYLANMALFEKTAPEVHANFLGDLGGDSTKSLLIMQLNGSTQCKMHNDISGITRNDQARDGFCVTWSELSRISQETRSLFNLEDDEDATFFLPF